MTTRVLAVAALAALFAFLFEARYQAGLHEGWHQMDEAMAQMDCVIKKH